MSAKAIIVYGSLATSNLETKKHQQSLTDLLEKKKAKYTFVDMGTLSKEDRDHAYEKAGTKTLPLCFVDGKFIGVSFCV